MLAPAKAPRRPREHMDRIAGYVAGAAAHPLDDATAEAARRGILDWLGVALGGSREEPARLAARVDAKLGGNAQATLIGRDRRTSAVQAALMNGVSGHALDFDDTHMFGGVHATTTVLPAALAAAELANSSSEDLLRAYATGFEVAVHLGRLLYPVHFAAAWHATAVFGTVGAAAAAAVLLGLDEEKTAHALAIAATQAAGVRANFGTMTKPFHAGHAASSGVLAALLAAEGFDAAADGLEGRQGFFRALGANKPEDFGAVEPLEHWRRVKENDFKLHACCHATHPAVDAALRLRNGTVPNASEIDEVYVRCDPIVATAAAIPDPTTGLESKFSVAYCVLTALLEGDATTVRFTDEHSRSAPARPLLPRVRVEYVPGHTITWADVEVRLRSGTALRASVEAPRGSSLDPASWSELARKFHDLARPVIGAKAASLEAAIRGLPRTPVAELMALVSV